MAVRDRWRAGLASALAFWASASLAQWRELSWVDPSFSWRTLETPGFSVHFAEQHRRQAQLVAGVAEGVYRRLSAALRWRAESRIELVVLDSADFANGVAAPVPFNYAALFLSPPDEGDLLQNREWLELVLTHEVFHVVHLDKAHDEPYSLRRVFGRLGFLFPNALAPRWMIEGLAVYAESDPDRGYGRVGQSQFEGMMRAEAARGPLKLVAPPDLTYTTQVNITLGGKRVEVIPMPTDHAPDNTVVRFVDGSNVVFASDWITNGRVPFGPNVTMPTEA